jgi:arginyl-tRNA synthetase
MAKPNEVPNLLDGLRARVRSHFGGLPAELEGALALTRPKDPSLGDVALPCFAFAKLAGKPPPAVASELAQALAGDPALESAVAAGPFVNFKLRRAALAAEVVHGVLAGEAPYGPWPKTGKSIVIDYSSPNIAKPFHMGHLRSTVIGNALVRIHRHIGDTVHGVNHLGDWGAQFGKIMTAFLRWGSDEQLAQSPMRHLFDVYVRYGKEAKEDPTLAEESRLHYQRLESGEDNLERRLWKRLRDISLEAFQGPYRRLGVAFDHYTGESFYEDKMQDALELVRKAGILEESEGAEVVRLEQFGIKEPCLLRKSDDTTIYATRDLAAIFYRSQTFRFDRAIYVVGSEQKLHFKQLIGVLKRMGRPEADRIEHVDFGLILAKNPEGKWEKFATRSGNAIFLDEVLDEAVANVRKIIREKNPDLENADAIAEQVGVSAIVFNDLKNSRTTDVKFDWDAMLNFEGETGPYVQYAVARLSGILRNAGAARPPADFDPELLADADRVLLSMLEFGPTVQRASQDNEPSLITRLMIQVAGEIHSWLREHRVIDAEPNVRDARLALVFAARRLLETGLGLLGVAAPERM